MSKPGILLAALAVAMAGCASDPSPMWAGPDAAAPINPVRAAPAAAAPSLTQAPIWTPPNGATPAPPHSRRVGSGVPPDLLRPPAETYRPTAPLTAAPPAYAPTPSPSPLDGPGYQRNGPITYGPGGPYNTVGSTIFGPGGKVCTPVGASLTCL